MSQRTANVFCTSLLASVVLCGAAAARRRGHRLECDHGIASGILRTRERRAHAGKGRPERRGA